MYFPWTVKDVLADGTSHLSAESIDSDSFGKDTADLPFAVVNPKETPPGLHFTWWHRKKIINMALQAAVLAFHKRGQVHYTQGPARWDGIAHHRKAWRGEVPSYADCSAFVTWCLWNGLDHFHYPDIINHQRWLGGYTGTLIEHGRRVWSPLPGDAILYGWGVSEHTALYTGGGLVISHGTESGPSLIPWNRMGIPVLQIRRYL